MIFPHFPRFFPTGNPIVFRSSHRSGYVEALEAALQGRTSFAIAHRLSTIQGATKVFVETWGERMN